MRLTRVSTFFRATSFTVPLACIPHTGIPTIYPWGVSCQLPREGFVRTSARRGTVRAVTSLPPRRAGSARPLGSARPIVGGDRGRPAAFAAHLARSETLHETDTPSSRPGGRGRPRPAGDGERATLPPATRGRLVGWIWLRRAQLWLRLRLSRVPVAIPGPLRLPAGALPRPPVHSPA